MKLKVRREDGKKKIVKLLITLEKEREYKYFTILF